MALRLAKSPCIGVHGEARAGRGEWETGVWLGSPSRSRCIRTRFRIGRDAWWTEPRTCSVPIQLAPGNERASSTSCTRRSGS